MSKQANKAGRTPIAQKEEQISSDFSNEEFDFNILKLDPELKAELEGQGLAWRWLNAPKYLTGGNYHRSGWRAYRKDVSKADRGSLDFNLGVSPEGYIIRNDLILGVKKKEEQAKWKRYLQHKAKIQSGKSDNGERAQDLREKARSAGMKVKVYEGYDDND